MPLVEALKDRGWHSAAVSYSRPEHEAVKAQLETANGVIIRIGPGTCDAAMRAELDELVRGVAAKGVVVMELPEVVQAMCGRHALLKVKELACGLGDTHASYDIASFKDSFLKTIAGGSRAVKQADASLGEGDWLCKLKEGEDPCNVSGSTLIDLQDLNDNHKEQLTIEEFVASCQPYLPAGGEQGGMLLDQPYLPRTPEGELRLLMVHRKLAQVVHRKPALPGAIANVASGSKYVYYDPADPHFARLVDSFVGKDMDLLMDSLGLEGHHLPLLWTADFVLGPKDADGADTYAAVAFNCNCIAFSQIPHLASNIAEAAVQLCSSRQ